MPSERRLATSSAAMPSSSRGSQIGRCGSNSAGWSNALGSAPSSSSSFCLGDVVAVNIGFSPAGAGG